MNDTRAPSPAILEMAQRWGVVLVERTSSRYSETWFGLRGDEHVVLKAGEVTARRREAAALRSYQAISRHDAGDPPAARLLEEEEGVLLIERLLLGDDLRPMSREDDDASTAIIARVIADLHASQGNPDSQSSGPRSSGPRSAGPQLPHLSSLGGDLDWYRSAGDTRIPSRIIEATAELFDELVATERAPKVLHGDLHHQNVLRSGEGWRAIDPHGWIGDPAFDAVAMMLNPYDVLAGGGLAGGGLVGMARRRAALISEVAGLDVDRILRWTAVGAVISEIWCVQDHGFVQGLPLRLGEGLLS